MPDSENQERIDYLENRINAWKNYYVKGAGAMLQLVIGFSELSMLKPEDKLYYLKRADKSICQFSTLCYKIRHSNPNGPLADEIDSAINLSNNIKILEDQLDLFTHQRLSNLKKETLGNSIDNTYDIILEIYKGAEELKSEFKKDCKEYIELTGNTDILKTIDRRGTKFKDF